jgi:hypothetical protein
MRWRNRAGLQVTLRYLLTQVYCQETLRKFDGMELRPQSFKDLLPLQMAGQTASGSTSDAMFAVQLHVERIKGVATGR